MSPPGIDPGSTLVAVILAAGGASRFGAPKQRHRLGGRALVTIAADAALAAGCFSAVVVVAGAVALDDLLAPPVEVIHNEEWASGQASSVLVGVAAAEERGATALVVGLADQPGVPAEAWRLVALSAGAPIAVATYAGERGNPVRLDRSVWSDLPREGDEGARVLIRRRPELVEAVACPGSPNDVDHPEDLDRWN